jgi:hypothetical protein
MEDRRRKNPLVIVRRLADYLVTVRNSSLQSGEIPNPACSLDLQGRIIDRCIVLPISYHTTNLNDTYLEELVDDRVEFVTSH